MTTIYLAYTDANGVAPFFHRMRTRSDFDFLAEGAKGFNRQLTRIDVQKSSFAQQGDAPIQIACLSDHVISPEESDRISYDAIDYLKNTDQQ